MKKRVLPAILIVVVMAGCIALSRPTRILFFAAAAIAAVFEMRSVLRTADMTFCVWVPVSLCAVCAALCLVGAPIYTLAVVMCAGVFTAMLCAMLGKTPDGKLAVNTVFVLMYPCLFFAAIMYVSAGDNWLPVLTIAVVGAWVCDSAALAVGGAVGRRRIAPFVSPNKTIEGCIGGALSSLIIGVIAFFAFKKSAGMTFAAAIVTAFVSTSLGQIGDLAASLIKRMAGVKDFSSLIPEHGGVMDKLDSMLFTIPSAWLCLRLFGII